MFTLLLCLFLLEMFSVFFLCCYFCPALPSGGGRLLERADRRLSRQHSQQSLTHSQAQSVSSLTSDLWDRSSAETPGIFPPRFCFLLTAGWTHGPTYVSRLWSTDETNSLSPRRIVHEGHCEVFINISQRVSQQQRFSKKAEAFSTYLLSRLSLSLCFCVSHPAPVLPGAYHQGVQMQQQQYHGYMHQTSMSSVRSVTSPPHSGTMVRSSATKFFLV